MSDTQQRRWDHYVRDMLGACDKIASRDEGYVALCPQVDVANQGLTVAEALTLFFETGSANEIDLRLRGEIYVTQIEVAVG